MILAIYDVSGIQPYIFSSNRMRENIGASRIVSKMLQEHLPAVLQECCPAGRKTCAKWNNAKEFEIGTEAGEHIAAEVVYIGGGNAIVAYRDEQVYHDVNKQLASRLIQVSYTLQLAVAAIETDCVDFAADVKRLEKQLAHVKAQMQRQRPPGAWPISEQEAMTGLPVTGVSLGIRDGQFSRPISTLQRLKEEAAFPDRKEIIDFPKGIAKPSKWAFEMEEMIQGAGEDSFVAVVHIDGNGMGKQLRERLQETSSLKFSYAHAVKRMREMSKQISEDYKDIFEKVLVKAAGMIDIGDQSCLPVRPLIMDGDDLTFVCKASWGLPLAAQLLMAMEQRTSSQHEDKLSLSACAGIALVHSHFPFDIAYEVAEACCSNAKKKRVEKGGRGGFIDFKVVRGSNPQPYEDTHFRYRPYRISADKHLMQWSKPDDFGFLASCLRRMQDEAWPRSRLEGLYEAYLGNDEQRELYLKTCESRKYYLTDLYSHRDEQPGGQYAVLDALELLDMMELQLLADLNDVGKEASK